MVCSVSRLGSLTSTYAFMSNFFASHVHVVCHPTQSLHLVLLCRYRMWQQEVTPFNQYAVHSESLQHTDWFVVGKTFFWKPGTNKHHNKKYCLSIYVLSGLKFVYYSTNLRQKEFISWLIDMCNEKQDFGNVWNLAFLFCMLA